MLRDYVLGRFPTWNKRLTWFDLKVADRFRLVFVAIGATVGTVLAAVFMAGVIAMGPHWPKASPAGPDIKHMPLSQCC